jgi:hypothetical protein
MGAAADSPGGQQPAYGGWHADQGVFKQGKRGHGQRATVALLVVA